MLPLRTALIGIAVLLVAGCLGLARADDGPPVDAPPLGGDDGPALGVLPPPPAGGVSEGDEPADAPTSPLVYRGGSVMRSVTTYAIYWVPPGYAVSPRYVSVIDDYFADVAHDSGGRRNVYSTDTQYYDKDSHGTRRPIAYAESVGGSFVDTAPFPAAGCTRVSGVVCLADSQLKLELARVIRAHHWPSGYAVAYFLLLPRSVELCYAQGACTYSRPGGFCAYHSYFGTGPTLYAAIPYATWLGCSAGQRPNGDDADDTLNGLSHEHNEMITDPNQRGWVDPSGYENGDKCAWTFGASVGGTAGGRYNQVIAGDHFYLQEEWSNDGSRCLQRY